MCCFEIQEQKDCGKHLDTFKDEKTTFHEKNEGETYKTLVSLERIKSTLPAIVRSGEMKEVTVFKEAI